MAAAFIFPNREVFTLGSHGFHAIVDRVRAAASADESGIIEPMLRPTDEGFDFLTLDGEIAPQAFRAFYVIAFREFSRCSKSNEAAKLHPDHYGEIMAVWSNLLRRMRTDSRCGPPAAD